MLSSKGPARSETRASAADGEWVEGEEVGGSWVRLAEQKGRIGLMDGVCGMPPFVVGDPHREWADSEGVERVQRSGRPLLDLLQVPSGVEVLLQFSATVVGRLQTAEVGEGVRSVGPESRRWDQCRSVGVVDRAMLVDEGSEGLTQSWEKEQLDIARRGDVFLLFEYVVRPGSGLRAEGGVKQVNLFRRVVEWQRVDTMIEQQELQLRPGLGRGTVGFHQHSHLMSGSRERETATEWLSEGRVETAEAVVVQVPAPEGDTIGKAW